MSNDAHSPNTTQDTGYTTSGVLDDIKTATDCISQATTQREYLQQLSEESERVWREIKLLPPVELVAVWGHVICYRELFRSIELAVNKGTMTEEEAEAFCKCLRALVNTFAVKKVDNAGSHRFNSSPSTSTFQGTFQNVDNISIFGGTFTNVYQERTDHACNHLKHIAVTFFFDTYPSRFVCIALSRSFTLNFSLKTASISFIICN